MKQKVYRITAFSLLVVLGGIGPISRAAEAPSSGIPAQGPVVVSLTCEYMIEPYGVAAVNPILGWRMESPARGQMQTAYRILVASSRATLDGDRGDAWDSGKVLSEISAHVRYGGASLISGKRYYWKVRAWDKDDTPTPWSGASQWCMGLLVSRDWKGGWIGGGTSKKARESVLLLRKKVMLGKTVREATAFVSGLGWSELFVNGTRIGSDMQSPSIANYQFRVPYMTYDVTKHLAAGSNAIGVLLANGYYSAPEPGWLEMYRWSPNKKLKLDLRVEYTDGTAETITSDTTWKWATGEYTYNDYHLGVNVDLTQAKPGWNTAGYDDSGWKAAAAMTGPGGEMSSIPHPPTQVIESLTPAIMDQGGGNWTFKLPNDYFYTGYPWLRTSGEKGRKIRLDWGAKSEITLSGGECDDVVEPRFAYMAVSGFTATGLRRAPTADDVRWQHVSNGLRPAGAFRCSDDILNYLHDSVVRNLRNQQIHGMCVDPIREKGGWLIEPYNLLELSAFSFDSLAYFRKLEWDILDWQKEKKGAPRSSMPASVRRRIQNRQKNDKGASAKGYPPSVTPGRFLYDGWNSMYEGGAVLRIPLQLYQYYGDPEILNEFYDGMKEAIEWMQTQEDKDHLMNWDAMGDHNPPSASEGDLTGQLIDEPPKAMLATIGYYDYLRGMSTAAGVLGKQDDAARYGGLAAAVKEAYNRRYFDPATGIYIDEADLNIPKNGKKMYQTIQAMALWFDLVPAGQEAQVLKKLVESLNNPGMAAGKYELNTGFVGTRYLIRALVKYGRAEEAYNLTRKTNYPSFFTTSHHGTFWETWAIGGGTICSLGTGIGFLMEEGLAGIRPDPAAPGFKQFILKPEVVGDVRWVEAYHDSPYGRITSKWNRENPDNLFAWDIVVPANSTATVYVPTSDPGSIKEGGIPAQDSPGVKLLRTEDNRVVYTVPAGAYHFTSRFPSIKPPGLGELP